MKYELEYQYWVNGICTETREYTTLESVTAAAKRIESVINAKASKAEKEVICATFHPQGGGFLGVKVFKIVKEKIDFSS